MTKVLIVEPNRERSSSLRDFFSKAGCKADCAFCGFEIYYLCHKKHYDIIIINADLPDFNGMKMFTNLIEKYEDSFYVMIVDKIKIIQKRFCKKHKIKLVKSPFGEDKLESIINEYYERKDHVI